MDLKITSCCIKILLLACIIEANNTSSNGESRQPRGSGRIVKLYSGARPDPIVCTNEGFQGDPNNCAVFYRCMKSGRGKYTAYRFQCPPGTVYDPDTEVCNHPRSTKRSECGGLKEPASPHYEVNEINEVQEFPMPITTKVPFYTLLSTPKASNPSFTSTFTTIRPTLSTTKHQETTLHPWFSSTKKHISVTSSVSPISQQNIHEEICTSDGFMGDSVNCHKFYRCVGNQRNGFTKYEFSCSEPTIWDDDIKSCNHPWAVKKSRCGRSNTLSDKRTATIMPEQTTSNIIPVTTANVFSDLISTENSFTSNNINKTIQNQLQISYGINVHQSQTQISNNSVIQNQTQIHYGDRVNKTEKEKNKQNQNQISHGSAVSQTQTQISYGNEVIQTQVQIDHSKQSSQSQVQIIQSTTPISKSSNNYGQDVTQNKQNINNKCSESGFMGDSNDCKKFYRCVDNGRGGFTQHEFSCGEGTLWDQTIEACNHAWAVTVCGGMPTRLETTTMLPLSSSIHSHSITSEKPNESYYPTTEVAHSDVYNDVEYNNNYFTSSSVGVTKTTTEFMHRSDTKCNTSGFIGDIKNCQIFYSCVENGKGGYTKYEFKCGEGTLWDADIGTCNHAWAVKRCGENTSPPTTLETTSKTITSIYTTSSISHITPENDDYDTGYGSSSGSNDEQLISSTMKSTILPPDQDVDTECQSAGFLRDKNDCKKFYRCVYNENGTYNRYEFACGEGTAWDPKIEGCNHAWAVDCQNNGITTTTTEVTTQKKPITIHEENESGYNMPESEENSDVTTQKTTMSTSSINKTDSIDVNRCNNSGFIGDTVDCKKFYRCVDNGKGSFIRHEFACGEGTVWDQKIEACNHAWAVEKCGGYYEMDQELATTSTYNVTISTNKPAHEYPTPAYPIHQEENTGTTTRRTTSTLTSTLPTSYCKKDGFIGDKMDCKRFYRCVNDDRGGFIKYQYQCSEGTVWDQTIEACNHAWAVKECGSVNGINENTTTTETLHISSSEQEYQPTEKNSSTTDNVYDNDILDICRNEGFVGDTRDCKKFYRCVPNGHGGYTKYEFTCGEGTYWNQITQACDHVSSEKLCIGYEIGMITKEPQHENDETHVETTTKVLATLTSEYQENTFVPSTEKPQSISTICHSEGFIGDQYDCQKFYRCVSDGRGSYTKYDFTCGEGTIWDQELITCAHKSKRNCSSQFTENSNETLNSNRPLNENEITNTSPTISKPLQTSTEKLNIPQESSIENISSGSYKCISEGFHANPTDCRKFIRCVNNVDGTYTKYDFTCGEGRVWVQELLACDHDDGTSSCHAQSEWSTEPPTNVDTSTHSHIPSSSSSTATYIESTEKNDSEYHTEITKKPQVLYEDCQSEGFYANNDDCRKYYRCVPNNSHGYIKYDFVCGKGTAWDPNLQTCNYDSAIRNCQGSYLPENQTESVVHDEISESTRVSTTSTTQASTTESKESTNADSEDNCENEGYFGSNKDCTKFYRCVDDGKGSFTKYDFTCGDGTIWDQNLLTCNHPHDVVNSSCNQNHGETSENTSSSSQGSSTSTSITQSSQSTTTQSSDPTTTQSSVSTINSTESSSNCHQEETSKKPGNQNVTCTEAGYYPDPNDCKKFYRCVDWDGNGERFSVYFFECGDGTIWDPALDTCNHEESVHPPRDCSNTQPQNTSSGQEPTTTEQSTTQESITSEKTTTEVSISENTTSQPPTTIDKTTTEQSTTSEQTTTTLESSNETTTTIHSMTSESTTLSSTTEGTTTVQVDNTTTTEQTTTTTAITESAATEEITTSGNTTEESTTVKSTTQQYTTEKEGTTSESISTTEMSTFSTTTTEASQQTSTTENHQETTTENSSSLSSCPDTDDDQYLFVCPTSFRRHPKYCNIFYQCTEDDHNHEVKVAIFNCPNNTIYDENKVQCVEEKKADKKCEGEIALQPVKRFGANYKEPIVVTKDAQKCSTVGHVPFEKNSECSPAFLKCEKTKSGTLRGFVHRCPPNYMYWSISRRCEREEVIRDCKRTINNWSGRWEIPIDRYNVAW